MYSFSTCIFSKWKAQSVPCVIEADGHKINYHKVFLPHEESLVSHAGTYSPISGLMQRIAVHLPDPSNVIHDISTIWLLDDPSILEPFPVTEKLLTGNIGMLYRAKESDMLTDFPSTAYCKVYSQPPIVPGIQFSAGTVSKGGFYLVFRTDREEPIDVEVFARYLAFIHNN